MPTIRPGPRRASQCTVSIRKLARIGSGDAERGWGTGFLYRDPDQRVWLVTNWHVLTGRRPDNPGDLLPNTGSSPDRISVVFAARQAGGFLTPLEVELYQNGNPIWREYKRNDGVDLAAIPIEVPNGSAGIAVQDFATQGERAIEPGLDVIITGYPFKFGPDCPFPIWKRAMIATEPAYVAVGAPQILLDTPGAPGMSGSPVYRSGRGFAVSRDETELISAAERGDISALDTVMGLSVESMRDEVVTLEFIGVYAGATGDKDLERLNLGRMFVAGFVDQLLSKGEPGNNPFPPSF